jgi:hypothetical protein
MEFRFELSFRLRARQIMRKASVQEATMARKPKKAITAIAQCGNEELLLFDCMLPLLIEGEG